jgi:hypothetical protein
MHQTLNDTVTDANLRTEYWREEQITVCAAGTYRPGRIDIVETWSLATCSVRPEPPSIGLRTGFASVRPERSEAESKDAQDRLCEAKSKAEAGRVCALPLRLRRCRGYAQSERGMGTFNHLSTVSVLGGQENSLSRSKIWLHNISPDGEPSGSVYQAR